MVTVCGQRAGMAHAAKWQTETRAIEATACNRDLKAPAVTKSGSRDG
jgi:hypothetical protein